ncbi:MAG: uracil-DNA glycosylase [Planctomycetales bacterium]
MPPDIPCDVARLLEQQLASWQSAGATHALVERRAAAIAIPASPPAVADLSRAASPRDSVDPFPAATPLAPPHPASEPSPAVPRPASLNSRLARLQVLNDAVRACRRCDELASTRTQTVFGVGNPQARILFIGEAPGADEDAQGEPFVGRAGQLLNQIIAACRLTREEIYICNVLKCRPPGNRPPLPAECANCREYLDGQLDIIDPEYIVCWGTVAAQNLLKTDVTIGKLRRRFFEHGRAKVLCTYHPSYLLRNPAAKKDVWEDMRFLFADMGIDLKSKTGG